MWVRFSHHQQKALNLNDSGLTMVTLRECAVCSKPLKLLNILSMCFYRTIKDPTALFRLVSQLDPGSWSESPSVGCSVSLRRLLAWLRCRLWNAELKVLRDMKVGEATVRLPQHVHRLGSRLHQRAEGSCRQGLGGPHRKWGRGRVSPNRFVRSAPCGHERMGCLPLQLSNAGRSSNESDARKPARFLP